MMRGRPRPAQMRRFNYRREIRLALAATVNLGRQALFRRTRLLPGHEPMMTLCWSTGDLDATPGRRHRVLAAAMELVSRQCGFEHPRSQLGNEGPPRYRIGDGGFT